VNIPTAEYQSIMRKDEQSPIRLAYERRNRDLDPQLVWRGKDEQDWSELVVHAPPLYIQEKVHPKVLIDDLVREREGRRLPIQTQLSLFVVFGEPDVKVTSGLWLVSRSGRMVAHYDSVKELSGLGVLAEINRLGQDGLSRFAKLPAGGALRVDQPVAPGGDLNSGEHRRGSSPIRNQGVPSIPEHGQRFAGRDGNLPDLGTPSENTAQTGFGGINGGHNDHQQDDRRAQAVTALKTLKQDDFPLALTTNHFTQVTIHGVDVFHPTTGEVRSDDVEGIACCFIDTDYNEESFFVCHAYFLGANDPYKTLKTTLKAEIDAEAWDTLNSNTSRPFPKPESGRIAVKVINHLGDEVMKVIRVE
jgi:adenine-specific DNA-methyltransferase